MRYSRPALTQDRHAVNNSKNLVNVPEISSAAILFPNGSRTGENTPLFVLFSFSGFSALALLTALPAEVEPLRAPAPTPATALDRVRAGDAIDLPAEGRRVGSVGAMSGSGWLACLTGMEDTSLAFESGDALTFFYNSCNNA